MPRGNAVALYTALESFSAREDGHSYNVERGDLVRAGHPVLRGREHLFALAEDRVRFDVEQATARPGELR
jgi:hypothetical protein